MTEDRKIFESGFFERNPAGVLERLKNSVIGIAGAGGLGSNLSASLVRAGAAKLIIADFDKVEPSNFNRQFFFPDQAGQYKVEALKANLLRINPYINVKTFCGRVTPANAAEIFGDADIMAEAFDLPEMKAMIVHAWLAMHPDRYIVTASGISGFGRSNALRTVSKGKIIVCGDQFSSLETEGGYTAPRVAIAANLEANAIIEILMRGSIAN